MHESTGRVIVVICVKIIIIDSVILRRRGKGEIFTVGDRHVLNDAD